MNSFYDPPQGKPATKPKSARYFGMTRSQIGILAGAATLALLVVCGLSWFILLPPPSAPALVPTAIEITPTPSVEVVTLTVTPSPTTPPVIATSVPPGGWVEFQTRGATIWLPDNFIGGDLLDKKSETIQKINSLGSMYRNAVDGIQISTEETVLWMIDKTVKQTDVIPTVRVAHFVTTEDTTIDQYVQSYLNSEMNGTPVAMLLTINETKKMTVLGRETRRLTSSSSYAGHSATGITYYIKDGADVWVIDYLLLPDEYLDMLPIVEQSIQTFNLVQ